MLKEGNMKNTWTVIVLGVAGLVLGYIFFGRMGEDYVTIAQLFGVEKGNIFRQLSAAVRAELLLHIRWNIILCGALGAAIGGLLGPKLKRK